MMIYMSVLTVMRHLFIPHHSNNHRPKVLHVDALFFYIVLFLLFNAAVHVLPQRLPDVLGYATDIHVEQLLADTNAKRQSAGLAALTLDAQLSEAAARKAADMFVKNYWAHVSPTGATPWEFITGAGYTYAVAGENLAKNFSDSQGVVDAWMASPSHRDNILKPTYKDIGFAVVNGRLNGEETTLVVEMFGSRASPTATAPQPVTVVPQAGASAQQASSEFARTVASAYSSVSKKPLIDLGLVSPAIAYGFIGILLGVLSVDALLVHRRRVVRVTGHNIAHIAFFLVLLFLVMSIRKGSLL